MIIHFLSASRLKKYLQCTEAYHQTYENKIRSDAVHLRFGTMVHSVFERYFQEEKPILELYEEEWRKHDVVDPTYYRDGLEMVRNFELDEDNRNENIVHIGFEVPFVIDIINNIVVDIDDIDFSDRTQFGELLKKLENDDTAYIFGFIDRIDYDYVKNVIKIIDYKTSRVAISKYESDTDIQLSMYALVAKFIYPEYENIDLTLNYVRLQEKVTTQRTPSQLDEFQDWLVNMYYIIKNDASPKATINHYCGWCDTRQGCVAYQELINSEAEDIDVKELNPDELDAQLEKINTHIKVLDGRKKEIEAIFKTSLTSTDKESLDVGENIRYMTNNSRSSYDVSTIINLFPDKFDKLLSVKKTEVDKIAKGNPEIQQALAETANKYFISPTLKKKKKKKSEE